MNHRGLTVLLALVTVVVRSVLFLYGGYQHNWVSGPFGYEYSSIAISLLNGEGYSSPFSPPPTGPTMWHPPILVFLLALIFKIFGLFSLSSYVTWTLINLFFSFICSLLISFIARNSFGAKTAALAQGFYVFDVFEVYKFRFMPANLVDEVFITLVILLGIAGFIRIRTAVGRGLLGGFLLFAHPMSFIPYSVCLMLALLKRTISLKRLGILLVLTAVTISPLLIRNYVVMDGFSLSKSNFFFEAYLGMVPESDGILTREIFMRYHPESNIKERKLMAEIGELNYVTNCRRRFFQMIRDAPSRFIELTLKRMNYFWVNFVQYSKIKYPGNPRKEVIIIQLYYILSLFSLVFCLCVSLRRKTEELRNIIVVIPFVYSIPYLITHAGIRYRTPIEPVIMMILCSTLIRLKEMLIHSPLPEKPKASLDYMHNV